MNAPFRVQHVQTRMFIASREVPRSEAFGARSNGAAMHYKWVRREGDAKEFPCYADAELPIIFLDADRTARVVDKDGNVVHRDEAIALGKFHSPSLRVRS